MRRPLLVTLSIGIGWVLGIVVMMITMPLGGKVDYTFWEAVGNTFVFGFPGFVMFMVALVLSLRDDAERDFYKGEF